MAIVVTWWLWMQIIGLAALPLAYRFFRRLPDRGYAFARPLGLLLSSYVLWLGGSFGLLRNSIGGALFSLVVVALLSAVVYRRGRRPDEPGLVDWLRGHVRLVLAVELLFAGGLALWALLRAYSPELTTIGGEKFMEIMFLNSIGRSEYMPPHDAWLGGYAISYYYFGYVMIAMLTRLSAVPAHLTFNVGLALLFALTCTGAFGLVYNLVRIVERRARTSSRFNRPVAFGFLGAILVAVMGNLEGFLESLYATRLMPHAFWRWLDIEEISQAYDPEVAASLVPTRGGWWWWRASRVIHDLDPAGQSMGIQPIDEFPGFSFLLGDMHPHVLALPFVLLVLAVALHVLLSQIRAEPEREAGSAWLAPVRRLSPLVPLCLGALGFLNTWDFPIYLLVLSAAYALGRYARYGRMSGAYIRDVAVTAGAGAALGVLFYLPFYLGFQSQAGGVLPALYVGTRFRQYFVMFGPFLVAIGGLLAALAIQVRDTAPDTRLLPRWAGWTAALLLAPLGMVLLVALGLLLTEPGREFLEGVRRMPAVYAIVGDAAWPAVLAQLLGVKLRTWLMPLAVAGLAALGLALLPPLLRAPLFRTAGRGEGLEGGSAEQVAAGLGEGPEAGACAESERRGALAFVLLCAVAGLLLTLSVEFFYLRDNFMVRMNTIFKFYFQGWVLMALAGAVSVYWLHSLGRRGPGEPTADGTGSRTLRAVRAAGLAAFWLLFVLGMFYPVLGNISRAGNFDRAPTLDGTAYIAVEEPDDYAAIQWLNDNVQGAPIILEAPGAGGDSYVYEGRVSALTGLPTLLGWAGHEGQWRGNYDVQHEREPDIEAIYNTPFVNLAQELLDKHDITYVYVGLTERARYEARSLEKFATFMTIVYQNDSVTIYKK